MYEHASGFAAHGNHLVSTDEMTGIQALERSVPTQPMRQAKTETPRV
ncbi:hypothetical protein MCP04_31110 (plasmid) [Leptolyngbya boryana IU 594]|nr:MULTISPECIES: hypothetical protein [unclassified Leptolyngbya]ULP33221.1 hypothetical protein MCP04_31110 [Leptolyngbya boryana IU 594]